jgi:hypothetical protein
MGAMLLAAAGALALAATPSVAAPSSPHYLDRDGQRHAADGHLVALKSCAPNGATGECVDHTWTDTQIRYGVCSDHGGLLQWITLPIDDWHPGIRR